MGDTKAKPAYRRRKGTWPPLVFDVDTASGTARLTAKQMLWNQVVALDEAVSYEVTDIADPAAKYLRERVLKLAKVVEAVADADPEDIELAAGKWETFFSLPGNEDLAWLGWARYMEELGGTLSKSSSPGGGDRAGAGGRVDDAVDVASGPSSRDAQLPAVPPGGVAAPGAAEAVPAG